ncbi:hypothetical protein ACFE04_016631 [Oxalis oulophora]
MAPDSTKPVIHSPSSLSPPSRKWRSMCDIMAITKMIELDPNDDDDDDYYDDDDDVEDESSSDLYSKTSCKQCGSGDKAEEMLLCDKCDNGYHMKCLRPIVVRVPNGPWFCPNCSKHNTNNTTNNKHLIKSRFTQKKISHFFRLERFCNDKPESELAKDTRKRRKRSRPLVFPKRRRRLLPCVPSEDPAQRLEQMQSLATALTAVHMEFTDDLIYRPGMARRSANEASFENGGCMQVLCREDTETLELCKAMYKRGECPPLVVVFDSCEGYTVEADGLIKDLSIIAEYTGDVDYLKNREDDDCDSIMTLLMTTDPSTSLVICADRRGNIARFVSGINNHNMESRKKQNCKCVRYDVDGECRVLLIATRDINKGERLYYDYNGCLPHIGGHRERIFLQYGALAVAVLLFLKRYTLPPERALLGPLAYTETGKMGMQDVETNIQIFISSCLWCSRMKRR